MSIARVKEVARAQKDQGKCEKCQTPLPAGSAYRWFKVGFRSRHKHVRCMDSKCTPRPSERESSRLADAYAAQEDASAEIEVATCKEDIVAALEQCRDTAEEVASEYESSIDSAPMLEDQLRDTISALEDWASNLDDVDLDQYSVECEACEGQGSVVSEEGGDADECSTCDGTGENHFNIEEAKEAAQEAVGGLEA